MSKELLQSYKPGPVPHRFDDLKAYIDDELNRIGNLIGDQQTGALLVVGEEVLLVPIDNTPSWNQLFVGEQELIDLPDGGWDPVTGVYTVPYTGLYRISLEVQLDNIGTQGSGTIGLPGS